MISIPISLKKDELFLNFFSNCNLSIRCYSLSVSVLSLSSVAIISSIESGIIPRIVVLERYTSSFATVYKGNIIKNLIMDCQSYTKYRPNETTGGIFVSWRRKEELPTGA